jgi:hypothetical protein
VDLAPRAPMPFGDLLEPFAPAGCEREPAAAVRKLVCEGFADPARRPREPDGPPGEPAQNVTRREGYAGRDSLNGRVNTS